MKLRELNILLFAAFAFFMLCVRNGDVLYTLSEQSLFIPGHAFWEEITPKSGVIGWLGCYLTQFMHIPWLGAMLLIALWAVIYYACVRIFHLRNLWTLLALIPVTVLLCQEISMGYHVFYMKSQGLAFVPTLYVLLVTLSALLVSAVVLLLSFCLKKTGMRRFVRQKAWVLPFKKPAKIYAVALFLLFWAALVVVVFHYDYSDANYHHELRMARSMDECQWQAVLDEAASLKSRPTNLMVVYKNIALLHTGQITKMFHTDCCGTQPYVRDSLAVHISQIAAPMIYYQLAMFNDSYRWAMENAVQYGMNISLLKTMVRCAIWNGEHELAHKYLNMLSATLFQKEWATEHRSWLYNAGSFQSHPEYKALLPLVSDQPDKLDYDQGACEKYVLDHFSDLRTDRPLLEDFSLCVSLWTESESDFVDQLELYMQHHPHSPLPLLYQEAAIMMSQSVFAPPWLAELPYDAAVTHRFQQFLEAYYSMANRGLSEQDMAEHLRSAYGTTYWWYYYFYTDFHIY